MKKIIPIILAFVIVFCSSIVPTYAMPDYDVDIYVDGVDPSGIMSAAEYPFEWPTWKEYKTMCSARPDSYTSTSSGTTYNLDMYIIWGSNTVQDTNTGNGAYFLHAFSSGFTESVSYRKSTIYSSLYHHKVDTAERSWRFTFTWDSSNKEWVYNTNSSSYFNVSENCLVGTNTTIYYYKNADEPDYNITFFPIGRSPFYQEALDTDSSLGYIEEEGSDDSGSSSEDWNWLRKALNGILEWADSVRAFLDTLTADLDALFFDIVDELYNFFTSWAKDNDETVEEVKGFFDRIENFFDTIFLGKLERLFIPEEDFMNSVFDKTNVIISENALISSIVNFFTSVKDFLNQDFTEPPSIVIDLSDTEGQFNYGSGKFNILDVSWFPRYRKYTDPLLSAVLWFAFMFLLVKRIPDILNGVGMITEGPLSGVHTHNLNVEKNKQKDFVNSYDYYKQHRQKMESFDERYANENKKE